MSHEPGILLPDVVMVTGSRTWQDRDKIRHVLECLYPPYGISRDSPPLLIHGDASGADTLAKAEAQKLGYTIKAFPADWDGLGRLAGLRRNQAMVDTKPDLVVAFWDGQSRGTRDAIRRAHVAMIPVLIIR